MPFTNTRMKLYFPQVFDPSTIYLRTIYKDVGTVYVEMCLLCKFSSLHALKARFCHIVFHFLRHPCD